MIIRKFMFFFWVVSLSISYANAENGSGTLSTISDIESQDIDKLKTIRETMAESQTQVDKMADENIGKPLKELNEVMIKAVSRIQVANSEFEKEYSKKASRKLLNTWILHEKS